MKLHELREQARVLARDTQKPYLWDDDELDAYANEAQIEACRRARLLVDSTSSFTSISVNSSTTSYPLDPLIMFVRRVKLASRAQPLTPKHIAELDEHFLGWEADTGEPRHYIKDMDTHAIRLYPQTTVNDTLHLTVVRQPLVDMVDDNDTPEIAPRYHRSLLQWMLHRMYQKKDSETLDPQASADALALFEAEFGKKSSAIDEAWIERQHGYIEAEGLY